MADKQEQNWWLLMGRYSHIAFVLPAAVFVGWLLGSALDKWLHTTWIFIPGILLGIVAGFVDLVRVLQQAEKDENRDPD